MDEHIYMGTIDLGIRVAVYIDPRMDRARCCKPGCGVVVFDPKAPKCPYGHRIGEH